MVRLKVAFSVNFSIVPLISIPYGAIKRRIWLHLRGSIVRISIPYGAIKRIFY